MQSKDVSWHAMETGTHTTWKSYKVPCYKLIYKAFEMSVF